jgi:type IV pilus assembly protein PilZ
LTQQRAFERYELVVPVILVNGTEELAAKSRNISIGGMLIESDAALAFGTKITVRIHLPAMKEPSELPATVRWVRDGSIGVQFGSLRAKETWALNQLTKPT